MKFNSSPSELYNAWYYYECFPDDKDGLYSFFSGLPHVKTNWPTPGTVPNGIGVQVHTLRLVGLTKRNDEQDIRNWLQMLVANRDNPLKLPPWLLYQDRENRLPFPIQLSEQQMFMFRISIEASQFSMPPERRDRAPALTLFIGVTEARSF